jgi:Sulfotransferase family
MRRDQLPPHKTATYVMQDWQAVYVSVNKAACTSLKWLVADLQGESRERFHRSLSREVSRIMTIHRRSLWQHTPMAAKLSDDELAAIDPDRGWFVFAVVRQPAARLWSAWQSKLLLREPWWVEQFADAPWFPRLPSSTSDIVEDFVRFAGAMAEAPDQEIMRNRHFAPQRRLLVPERMPYTRIYQTHEIPQLMVDFERHLRGRGWEGERLVLERANETPLKPLAALFPPSVVEAVRSLYGEDFEAFGYDDVLPGGLERADAYSDAALAEIGRLIERSERINDLAMRARTFKREAERARAAASRATKATAGNDNGVRSLAARARRRLVRTLR